MCADKTYDPKPSKLTYLFGDSFFMDEAELDKKRKEQAFDYYLRYLSDGNTKVYSRTRAGLSVGMLETKRTNNSEFRALEERALEEGAECVEQEAIRRGRDGYSKDVYYKGAVVGQERVYSDALLLAVLKTKNPLYRESRSVVTADVTNTNVDAKEFDASKFTEEELLQLEELLQKGSS